ncbi:MAG: hypothetical protein HW416_492 [Chloroflexi bacterium]|nr:hypothetical protein [Chloroflexota bacterium]
MDSPATWSGYSLSERDRRWNAVRAGAAAAGFDCIFVPVCLDRHSFPPSQDRGNGPHSDSRYLTQLAAVSVVLPTDGRTPIVIGERTGPTRWIPEVRSVSRRGLSDSWADPMATALLDAGIERGRIGVVGLAPGKLAHVRAVDGVVNHTGFAGVAAQLPQASFENATDIVGAARYAKGEEEIACLRRAAEIAAAAIQSLQDTARPGVAEAALYARGMRRLLELGSEYFPLTLQAEPLGRLRYRHRNSQLGRTLGSDWIVEAEVNAVWGGQVAQETQTIALSPLPDAYRAAGQWQREIFASILDALTPGSDLADLAARINSFGGPDGLRASVSLQSAGYGDDGPWLRTGDSPSAVASVRIDPGTAWVCQVTVHGDHDRLQLSWGTTVLVTEQGATQLVSREMEPVSIQ